MFQDRLFVQDFRDPNCACVVATDVGADLFYWDPGVSGYSVTVLFICRCPST